MPVGRSQIWSLSDFLAEQGLLTKITFSTPEFVGQISWQHYFGDLLGDGEYLILTIQGVLCIVS